MREDWVEVELGKVLILSKEKHKSDSIESLFYIGLEHIEKSTGNLTKNVGIEEIKTVKNKFRQRQILYGKLRPYLNKVYLAKETGVCSTDILVFNVSNYLNAKYALLFMLSRNFVNDMSANTSGVNLPRVSTRYINHYNFPLPPLPIQRAIVSKIETLFSDLDKGIADLKKVQEQLKIYRQAVLKKAFEGELTKEWREQQTDLPTAEELLEQIKEERQKHYEQQLEEWKQAVKVWGENGKKGKKPGKPKKLGELVAIPKSKKVPKSWVTSNLSQIGYWTGGGTPSKTNKRFWQDGNIPWITSKDMKSKDLYTSQDKITEQSIKESSAKYIKEGSILVVLRSGILRRILPIGINKVKCTVNQDLQALTPYSTNTEYIYWFLVSNEFDIRYNCAKDGTTVESVEATLLKLYIFPLCSIQEQHQIVREIESRLSVCDKVEQNISEALEKSEGLRQSILKKAFEGKLLSPAEIEACRREADYEPASVLLERIEKEKANAQ